MSYPNKHIKLTISGGIAGEDIWSNGIGLGTLASDDPEVAFQTLTPGQFEPAVRAFYINANALSNYCTLTTIKLSLIGTNGKTIGEPKFFDFQTPVQGQYTGAVSPQDSIVVSLITDAPRGLASKGRLYLPPGFGAVGAQGKLPVATTESIRNRMITFLDAINTIGLAKTPPLRIGIFSSVGAGAIHGVTKVKVGNMVDSQRRRRNRISETYVEGSLTT